MEVTIDFFLLLLLLHIIGDFYLQSEKMCENKRQKGIKSKCLYLHLGIITLVFAAPAICCHTFIPWFALIILSHSVIDIGKSYFEKKYPRYTLYYFFGDQLSIGQYWPFAHRHWLSPPYHFNDNSCY